VRSKEREGSGASCARACAYYSGLIVLDRSSFSSRAQKLSKKEIVKILPFSTFPAIVETSRLIAVLKNLSHGNISGIFPKQQKEFAREAVFKS
jgi:hypothetical protein